MQAYGDPFVRRAVRSTAIPANGCGSLHGRATSVTGPVRRQPNTFTNNSGATAPPWRLQIGQTLICLTTQERGDVDVDALERVGAIHARLGRAATPAAGGDRLRPGVDRQVDDLG